MSRTMARRPGACSMTATYLVDAAHVDESMAMSTMESCLFVWFAIELRHASRFSSVIDNTQARSFSDEPIVPPAMR